jgi:hypothetical protein
LASPLVHLPCAESVHVAGECCCHLDTLGPDERKGDIQSVRVSHHRRRGQQSVLTRWHASTTIARCAQLTNCRFV